MIRIQQIGECPWELSGFGFEWIDEPKKSQKTLFVATVEVGSLSYAVLDIAGSDAPLTVYVDWPAITASIRGK